MRGLDAYEGAPVEALRGAARGALSNLVELAIEERVDFVLLAGDIYDGAWKDHNTGLFFVREMGRLRQAGIRVFCLYGNHDAENQLDKKLRLPDNVHAFGHQKPGSQIARELGVAVHGQSFAQKVVDEDLAAGYPEPEPGLLNIGLLHTGLGGRPGHSNYAPTNIDVLRGKGYDYWALGHIHEREVVSQDPWIVFPGNLQGRHVRETGAKGATLVQYEGQHILSVEHHSLDLVRWQVLHFQLENLESMDALLERVRDDLDEALGAAEGRLLAVRIMLDGTSVLHAELSRDPEHVRSEVCALAEELAPDLLFIERIKINTNAPLDLESLRQREDPVGCVARRFQALESQPETVEAFAQGLAEELASFQKKLPREARLGGEHGELFGAKNLKEILPRAEQLLLARLAEEDR